MSALPADLYAYMVQVNGSGGVSETTLRAAISRGYYATYHGCNDWHNALLSKGHDIGPRGGKHQVLINQLCNPAGATPVMSSKSLGYSLRDLRPYRITADYDLSATVDLQYSQEAEAKAALALKKLGLIA